MVKALQKNKIESDLLNQSLAWLFYRNAYSVANDLSKSKLSFVERRKKLKDMCIMFNSQKVAPIGIKCKIISLPVKLKLVGLLDVLFQLI